MFAVQNFLAMSLVVLHIPVLDVFLREVPLPCLNWVLVDVEVGLEVGTSAAAEAELGLGPVAMALHMGVCVVGPLPLTMATFFSSNKW